MGRKRREPTAAEIKKVRGWAGENLGELNICEKLGLGHCTWNRWKKDNGHIRQALKEGREIVVDDVERAMHRAAIGHEYDEVRIETRPDGSSHRTVTTKEIQPHVIAGIFVLKNERGDKYKDQSDVNVGGQVTILRPDPRIKKPKNAGRSKNVDAD